jgi:hypothetical protein
MNAAADRRAVLGSILTAGACLCPRGLAPANFLWTPAEPPRVASLRRG